MAHAAPGRVSHLAVLQVIASLWKQIVIAAVVVMQVADDDVFDAVRRYAERVQSLAHRLEHFALPFPAHRLVKAGVEDDRAGCTGDRPNEEIERLKPVVRIAVDVICRSRARMVPVADGVDFVGVVTHVGFLRFGLALAPVNRPVAAQINPVLQGQTAGGVAAWQCRTDRIFRLEVPEMTTPSP